MKTTRYILAALLLVGATSIAAQESAEVTVTSTETQEKEKVEATIGADFVSQYIWRGQDLGNISMQPTLGIGYKGLSLSAWGSVGVDSKDTKEVDLTLSYSIKGFSIGVTDYWFSEGRYFKYKAHQTTHVFEAGVGYDFNFLSIQWYTNFAGDDGVNEDGERAYSSYFEISAPFRLGGLDWTATVGAVPYATSFYDTSGFAITNVSICAAKEFVVKDKLNIPVYANLSANPRTEKVYLVFGVSFSM
ncbi:MAG: hypothetical protein PUG15_00790 [Bacteroidales bacterium]|nr:hypothetical protein [Bacteroidales bacterium]